MMKMFGVDLAQQVYTNKPADEWLRAVKFFVDTGRFTRKMLALACQDAFDCSGRACCHCLMHDIREAVDDWLVSNGLTSCGGCKGLQCVILAYLEKESQKGQKTGVNPSCCCKTCGNYTLAGCKEHIDWYPEENDYCSKYKKTTATF